MVLSSNFIYGRAELMFRKISCKKRKERKKDLIIVQRGVSIIQVLPTRCQIKRPSYPFKI